MSVLRIFSPLSAVPTHCAWILFDDHAGAHPGEGALTQLPRDAEQVELVLAAPQVLITRVPLPQSGKRHSAALLAYAAEERLITDPDANQVRRLGTVDGEGVLAVVDRQRLESWYEALGAMGIEVDRVYCETLMLPLHDGEWSLAWDGREGHVRSSEIEGGATDCGDRQSPPQALARRLDDARARDAVPVAIALHLTADEAQPDLEAWQRKLGVRVRVAADEDWRMASAAAMIPINVQARRWRFPAEELVRWRRTAWVMLVVLVLHAGALLADRAHLAGQQHQLRQQMEARFRSLFPEALAVADPVLQTRRKLAQARHAAMQPDEGDFSVILGRVAPALAGMSAARLNALAYADGRMTLEFPATSVARVRQIEASLVKAGFDVQAATAAAGGSVTMTLRPQ